LVCGIVFPHDGGGSHQNVSEYSLTVDVQSVGPTCRQ